MSHTATETATTPGTADTGRAATWRDRPGAPTGTASALTWIATAGALMGPLLTPGEAAEIAALYTGRTCVGQVGRLCWSVC
jgi:homospermidine synthase